MMEQNLHLHTVDPQKSTRWINVAKESCLWAWISSFQGVYLSNWSLRNLLKRVYQFTSNQWAWATAPSYNKSQSWHSAVNDKVREYKLWSLCPVAINLLTYQVEEKALGLQRASIWKKRHFCFWVAWPCPDLVHDNQSHVISAKCQREFGDFFSIIWVLRE